MEIVIKGEVEEVQELDDAIEKIYLQLKNQVGTYAELMESIDSYCREVMFQDKVSGTFLLSKLTDRYNKDIDNVLRTLPIQKNLKVSATVNVKIIEISHKYSSIRVGGKASHNDMGKGIIVGFSDITGEPFIFFYSLQGIYCIKLEELTFV